MVSSNLRKVILCQQIGSGLGHVTVIFHGIQSSQTICFKTSVKYMSEPLPSRAPLPRTPAGGTLRRGARRLLCSPRRWGALWKGNGLGGQNHSTFSRMNEWVSEWVNEWMKFKHVRKWVEGGSSCVMLAGHSGLVWGLLTSIYWLLFGRSCCSKLMEINDGSMAVGCCFYSCFPALSWFSSIGCKSFL